MKKLYVIKFNNECYWCGSCKFSKELRHAQIYVDLKRATDEAEWILKHDKFIQDRLVNLLSQKTFNITYKLVEVEIKEVEEQ